MQTGFSLDHFSSSGCVTLFSGFLRFVGISRLYDNKHHVTDILAGGLIGIGVAIFFGVVVLRLHESKSEEEEGEVKKDETHDLAEYATEAT